MRPLPPILTIAGLSKSGKTTVAAALIGVLCRRGLRVASIKSMTHGELSLEPEGVDTRRHLEAGAEATIAFAADTVAVFTRPPTAGPREHLERWLPAGIDMIVCEGVLAGIPPERVVLCLERVGDFEEALAVRGLAAESVVAVSGVAAGALQGPGGHDAKPGVPLLDARDPGQLASLAELSLRGRPRHPHRRRT